MGEKGGREVRDFRAGDRVIVKDNGGSFTTYRGFFKENGLTKWEPYYAECKSTTAGEKYTIVATGKHGTDNFYGTLYLLRSEDGKIYIMNNNGYGDRRVYMELVKGERKLFASELMELARKEPQKYEGKRYKVVEGAYDCDGHAVTELYVGTDGDFRNKFDGYRVFVGYDTELEEIPQTVIFSEAVKAAIKGKKPTITLDGDTYTLTAEKSMLSGKGYWLTITYNGDPAGLSTGMIDGMWTVE